MNDPLRIFTKEQLKNLNPFHLNRLKKEFFLPFRYGGSTTVVLNNHEIDRPTLEAIFEELEANLDEYTLELEHWELKEFFENDSLEFLYDDKKFQKIKNLLQENSKLEARVAKKLSPIILKISKDINSNIFSTLNILFDLTLQFSPQNREIAFQKCYEEIEGNINNLSSTYIHPFKKPVGIDYSSDIGMHMGKINPILFDYLPESFKTLDVKYSKWCFDVVVNKTLSRQSNLKKYTKRDLKIFQEAIEVASRHHDSDALKSTSKAAKQAQKGSKSKSGGLKVIGIIFMIYSFIKLISFISNLDLNKQGNSTSDDRTQQEIMEDLFNDRRKGEEKRTPQNKNRDNTKTKTDYKQNLSAIELSKSYAGNNWKVLDASESQVMYTGDTLIVECNIGTIPTVKESISTFLPEYKGNISDFALITFLNKDLNIKTSHLLDIKYNNNGKFISYEYSNKESSSAAKLALSTKRIPYGDFNVKGHMLRKNTINALTKELIRFEITYDRESKMFKIDIDNKISFALTKSEVAKPYYMERKDPYAKKFATIINNLGALHNKFIKEKNWYSIENVAEYEISTSSKLVENGLNYESRKGHLRLNFVSNKDNIAYCELNTKLTAFKYFFDQKSGILKGMVRATTSLSKNEVEQIIVIRQ